MRSDYIKPCVFRPLTKFLLSLFLFLFSFNFLFLPSSSSINVPSFLYFPLSYLSELLDLSSLFFKQTIKNTKRKARKENHMYTRLLKLQRFKRKTHGFRTFSQFGPHVWNMQSPLRHQATLSSFKSRLNVFLVSKYFS